MLNIKNIENFALIYQLTKDSENNDLRYIKCNHLLYLSYIYFLVYDYDEYEDSNSNKLFDMQFEAYPAGPILKDFVSFINEFNDEEVDTFLMNIKGEDVDFNRIQYIVTTFGDLSYYELAVIVCGKRKPAQEPTPWFLKCYKNDYQLISREYVKEFYTVEKLNFFLDSVTS